MNISQLTLTTLTIVAEAFISWHYIKQLQKCKKCKNLYPLKQLSIKLSIPQGISFYLYQLSISIFFIFQLIKNEEIKLFKITCDTSLKNFQIKQIPELLIEIIYLTSRGFCFSFTFVKSLRAIIIFRGKILKRRSFYTYFCKNEQILLIISVIYGCLYPLGTFSYTILLKQKNPVCAIIDYENGEKLLKQFDLSEELLTFLCTYYLKSYHFNDKIIELTLMNQIYFQIWLICNALLFTFGEQIGYNLIYLIVFSCWIRCHWMFYQIIYIPNKKKEKNPNIYIKTQQVNDFKMIISPKFNNLYKDNVLLQVFIQFLQSLQQSDQSTLLNDFRFQNITEIQMFDFLLYLNEQIKCWDETPIFDKITKFLDNQGNYSQGREFYKDLLQHFRELYDQKYKNTKSFQQILNYCQCNEIVLQNLQMLNIEIDEWDAGLSESMLKYSVLHTFIKKQ